MKTKKILAALLASAMTLSCAACSSSQTSSPEDSLSGQETSSAVSSAEADDGESHEEAVTEEDPSSADEEKENDNYSFANGDFVKVEDDSKYELLDINSMYTENYKLSVPFSGPDVIVALKCMPDTVGQTELTEETAQEVINKICYEIDINHDFYYDYTGVNIFSASRSDTFGTTFRINDINRVLNIFSSYEVTEESFKTALFENNEFTFTPEDPKEKVYVEITNSRANKSIVQFEYIYDYVSTASGKAEGYIERRRATMLPTSDGYFRIAKIELVEKLSNPGQYADPENKSVTEIDSGLKTTETDFVGAEQLSSTPYDAYRKFLEEHPGKYFYSLTDLGGDSTKELLFADASNDSSWEVVMYTSVKTGSGYDVLPMHASYGTAYDLFPTLRDNTGFTLLTDKKDSYTAADPSGIYVSYTISPPAREFLITLKNTNRFDNEMIYNEDEGIGTYQTGTPFEWKVITDTSLLDE